MSDSNLHMLARVAAALDEAGIEALFVGGATIGLYLDPVAAARVRSTLDVDCVVTATSRAEFARIEERLQAHGFSPCSDEGAPLCRWILDGQVTVDIMPLTAGILGFSNRFYQPAIESAESRDVEGRTIEVAPVALALAMKVEAYASRGASDPLGSRDLEDAIALLDGCADIVEAVASAVDDVRHAVGAWADGLLGEPRCSDLASGHLGASDDGRVQVVLERLRALAAEAPQSRSAWTPDAGRVSPTGAPAPHTRSEPSTLRIAAAIERYLRTGQCEPRHESWPGQNIVEAERRARVDLTAALLSEVQRRTAGLPPPPIPADLDPAALTRAKVEPMVRGLFSRAEQDRVLDLVAPTVVFVTPANIERVLREGTSWLSTAWKLANLYLESRGAELLAPDALRLLGMAEDATCFVSTEYFTQDDPFADFVVHEVAHHFHNWKRHRVGLSHTRRRQHLLEIAYPKRETFAYACEAYSCIARDARRPADRIALAEAFGRRFHPNEDRVDRQEVASLVREAAARRNGWKVILAHCAAPPRARPG